ncbi:type II toxin-antitoxin system prevent-host-death family antitoxin [uncultured Parolsenella sp.]|uniref:type II toxin-antitoxin system prevent-host-death family antitoxin n=1 Tax=uncultured Parolsenella sp. TaxID=2083008 RepID=UPI0027D93625|nr:type II toxin-antitoxin system prevent-host-death family antitoxin [uncultured Parolsenella sp.]
MTRCLPITALKNTSAFSESVRNSDGPIIITRNGHEDFAVIRLDDLEALRQESARAHLYQLVSEAEASVAEGRVRDARASQAEARARYGL